MAGVNKVILLGRLGRDPEITYTQSGMAVCKLSIATSKKRKDGNEITSWHRCTAFDRAAEILGQYLNKGREIYIEGELQYGQYDKDGVTHYTTDIIVRDFSFISGSGFQNQQNNFQGQNFQQQGYQNQNTGFQRQADVQTNPNQGNSMQNNQMPENTMDAPYPSPPDDEIPF